jgi:autotransporter-associated beta strand protein/T5SS/PEP-CTERM-associated repeat protein
VVSGSITNNNDLIVGDATSGVTLVVTNPGSVSVANVYVGNTSTSSSNSVIVGTNATLTVSDTFFLGADLNSGNQFLLTNGGVATLGSLNVGFAGSVSNTITVTGNGSQLNVTGELDLTNTANSIVVSGGGSLTSGTAYIGSTGGSSATNNSVLVTGSNSRWSLGTNGLVVGDNSDNNSVVVTASARLVSGLAVIGTDLSGTPSGSNKSILVNSNGSWTNSGNITVGDSGSGTLTIASGGNVTANALFLANSNNSVGTLNIGRFGTNDAAGTLTLTGIYNSITFGSGRGSINFNQSNTATIAANISGAGSVNQLGSGTSILTGDNGYSAGTRITNGVLQVGAGGTNGTLGSGNVTNNASLVFNRSDYAVFGNTIAGSGSLTQSGSGTTVFTGNNSYSGVTTISRGVLQIGNNGTTGTLGSGNVVINTNALLSIYRDGAYDLTNAISGGGSLDVRGSGTKTLLGNNTYQGATFVDNATLQVGKNGTNSSVGSGNVNLTNYGSLLLNITGNSTLTNVVAGQGDLNIQGSGTTTITGANTYTEYTTIGSNATLQVGDGGLLGRLGGGTVFNRNAIIFKRMDTLLVTNSIQDVGSLTQSGSGTLLLTGSNSYSGYTAVTAGSLSLGSTGTLSGGGTITVSNGATLLLGAANQINTNTVLNLGSAGSSGTLSMGANGTNRASTQTFNTLTLSANSSIDFANLTGQSALYFSKIGGLSTYTLSIFNYNGSSSTTGGEGQYTSLYAKAGAGTGFTDTELGNIKFYSGSDASSTFLGGGSFSNNTSDGFNQIVPVPEPGVVLAGLLLLGWMIVSFRSHVVRAVRVARR